MFNLFGKNDWYPVWTDIGVWNFSHPVYPFKTGESRCTFEILYSRTRNKYQLKTSGDSPKTHSKYHVAVQKLNEFIKNGHE